MLFVLGAQKYNQNNLAMLNENFFPFIFGHDLGFKLVCEFGLGLGLYFRVWAEFGPKLVGPFTTLSLQNHYRYFFSDYDMN